MFTRERLGFSSAAVRAQARAAEQNSLRDRVRDALERDSHTDQTERSQGPAMSPQHSTARGPVLRYKP